MRGLTFSPCADLLLSCGSDKTVKVWKGQAEDPSQATAAALPHLTFAGANAFLGIDHQKGSGDVTTFGTCGASLDLWDLSRSSPLSALSWGTASALSLAFNPVETHTLASTGSDRNIVLYDVRGCQMIRKVILKMKSNQLSWNPMEAFNFVGECTPHSLSCAFALFFPLLRGCSIFRNCLL